MTSLPNRSVQVEQELGRIREEAFRPVAPGRNIHGNLLRGQQALLQLDQSLSDPLQRARVRLALGKLYVETQQLGKAMEWFASCEELLLRLSRQPGTQSYLMQAYNLQGDVWISREDPHKAEPFYKSALECYESTAKGDPLMEELHAEALAGLEQVYTAMHDEDEAAYYLHRSLQAQLALKKPEPDWAAQVLRLGCHHLKRDRFVEAEYCCRAAAHVGTANPLEIAVHRSRYYLKLLKYSRQTKDDPTPSVPASSAALFDLPIPCVAAIPFAKSLPSAELIFERGAEEFKRVLDSHTLHRSPHEHLEALVDFSQLHNQLSYFQPGLADQIRTHDRRRCLLRPVVGQVNVQVYTGHLRSVLYELGEVCTRMSDLLVDLGKTDSSAAPGPPTQDAIKYFNMYLNTFLPVQSEAEACHIPQTDSSQYTCPTLDSQQHSPWVMANMYIAKMWTRLPASGQTEVDNLLKAYQRYRYLVASAEANDMLSAPQTQMHVLMCSQLAEVLPARIHTLQAKLKGK
eukprot:NODE_1074_length_1671_cov_52.645725_g1008_i0.p1 GENE.NODE_1074_length_1671_cov_52.645725_g1008_i0~~NODE_1074_length_1671_cov_52.645725_g1008_i0.p1  ORF type:complete len:542 (+),score=123.58 NODE_1074_length_1671_cov_52.645725_g1008_i0:82-1626(+)